MAQLTKIITNIGAASRWRAHGAPLLLILFAVAAAGGCKSGSGDNSGPRTATIGDDFENSPVGSPPRGWTTMETHGKGTPAVWRVEENPDAPTGRRVLSLVETTNAGGTFNLCIFRTVVNPDITVSTQLRARAGREDQGGGVVWRLRDENNYYLARWNPLENNIRAYRVEDGARKMLVSAEVKADPADWHRIEVLVRGRNCIIYFDGVKTAEFEDDANPAEGRTGVWTKADAATLFDQFAVTSQLSAPDAGKK